MKVLITGSASGIGLAAAKKFLAEGFTVTGVDVKESPLTHPDYTHIRADIRGSFPVPEAEILINSAGTIDEELAVEVNLLGTMRFTERCIGYPGLRSVLFIASASARNGAEFPYYVASKAGLVGYMKNLALSLAKRGVTVNSISPGGVVTPMNAHILESGSLYSAVKNETLLGKWAEPSEIAELAYYLTVTNRSMTGEDILVDNGEMLKSNFIW